MRIRALVPPSRGYQITRSMKREYLSAGRDYVRELVRKRDRHTCQIAKIGKRSKKCKRKWKEGMRRFDVHHINGLCGKKSRGYDRKEDMKGLITICHSCHMSLGHIYPRAKKRWGVLNGETAFIVEMRQNGDSYDRIGRRFGVSAVSVRQHLIRVGMFVPKKLSTGVKIM